MTTQKTSGTCLQCGRPVKQGDFCCSGCEAAYKILHEQPQAQETSLSRYIETDTKGDHRLNLMVDGMHCASCAFLIEATLKKEEGVEARVNLTTRRLNLSWQGEADRATALIKKVTDIGYKVTPFDEEHLQDDDKRDEKNLLKALAVAGFASGNIMMLSVGLWAAGDTTMGLATRDFMHWVSGVIALPTLLYSGRPFFASAWEALKNKRTNMDVPISVALILTTAMSLFEVAHHGAYAYFDSVTMLLY